MDGKVIAAAQEERFTRVKHDKNFPVNAIKYCIEASEIKPSEIENVVFYENLFLNLRGYLKLIWLLLLKGFEVLLQLCRSGLRKNYSKNTILLNH